MEKQPHRLHFIGIKGVGMSALAVVAQGMGYHVTGSDVDEEFITDSALLAAGITPQPSFDANHIDPAIDTVVLGAAYGDDNPEVAEAKRLHLPLVTYSEMLGRLSRQRKTIAVAGTHGKTTTTALLAFLLYKAGLSPSWLIGTGHIAGLPSHGYAGDGEYFITEADDYKRAANDPAPKFLDLTPYGAIITSIEHDHPDLYPTLNDCVMAFRRFLERVRHDGFIVANGDDATIHSLMAEFPQPHFFTYGVSAQNSYRIEPLDKPGQDSFSFLLYHQGQSLGEFTLALPGQHNMYNAAAAVITGLLLGVTVEDARSILPHFQTVERRYQVLGTTNDILVIDDYAHHPTAIQTTLETAKKQFPDRPLWCVFQPHTYSRTKALLDDFAQAFAQADETIITDIFASAREQAVTITASELAQAIKKFQPHVQYVAKSDLLEFLRREIPPHAVLITMGAGDIYKIGHAFVSANPAKDS